MQPTMKLRFVRRPAFGPEYCGKLDVLQQWWETPPHGIAMDGMDIVRVPYKGEWRDVPMEEE